MSANKYRQIAFYPDEAMRKKIEKEAKEQHRALGPTVLEIVRRFFAAKENPEQS